MSPISSKPTPVLDGSAAGFRRAAGDLGEAIAKRKRIKKNKKENK